MLFRFSFFQKLGFVVQKVISGFPFSVMDKTKGQHRREGRKKELVFGEKPVSEDLQWVFSKT